jgi:multiple sugar transport system ATP-binding protein
MVAVSARSLTKVFGDGITAVSGIDLEVASGEFMVLLGPTGCGKSTLLRLLSGMETPTSGEVRYDGVPVQTIAPRDRHIAMVFQGYALYPHLSVAQNIGFPLRSGAEPPGDVPARIAEAARHLGITDLLNRLPAHLSGGQQQRVAMARAIIREPELLLLDEPMSNVDAGVRADLRGEITGLARRLAVTTVYVTHDQAEAMSMADRVAVLRQGVLQQVGPPAEVYADPETVFVAAFLGSPPTSLLEGAIYAGDGQVVLDLGGQVLTLPPDDPRTAALAAWHTSRVTVGLRALSLARGEPGMEITGTVRTVENVGHELLVRVDTGGVPTPGETSRLDHPVRPAAVGPRTPYGFYPTYAPAAGELAHGAEVVVRIPTPAKVVRGEELHLAVTLDDLLLFDRAGKRIRFFDR